MACAENLKDKHKKCKRCRDDINMANRPAPCTGKTITCLHVCIYTTEDCTWASHLPSPQAIGFDSRVRNNMPRLVTADAHASRRRFNEELILLYSVRPIDLDAAKSPYPKPNATRKNYVRIFAPLLY